MKHFKSSNSEHPHSLRLEQPVVNTLTHLFRHSSMHMYMYALLCYLKVANIVSYFNIIFPENTFLFSYISFGNLLLI